MKNKIVRIKSIEIENFKNVKFGHIDLLKNDKKYNANFLALYGQNGSGKTALINVIQILKYVLCGKSIPVYYADYISIKENAAKFKFEFDVCNELGHYDVEYSFELTKCINNTESNTEFQEYQNEVKTAIKNEVLSSSFHGEDKNLRKVILMDTNSDFVFGPTSKYNLFIGDNKKEEMNLMVDKRVVESMSKGFIFSSELLSRIRKRKTTKQDELFHIYYTLIEQMVIYGNHELFVIDTRNNGMISMDVQPFSFKYKDKSGGFIGTCIIPLDEETVISLDELTVVKKVIRAMNSVLVEIIPGLMIDIKELGKQLLPTNQTGYIVQLVSMKNEEEIPLRYESEGIKKIISILQLLISVYNEKSITVAIDELDSGIFEYLLGELLRIICHKGKGQLIYTSHNLRPLETIDSDFIAFTTTNPNNRYVRMKNIQQNNNLRDVYYRSIVLGGSQEELYSLVHNTEIDFAFKEAGLYED